MKRSLVVLVVCFCACGCALGQTGSCAKNSFQTQLYYAGGHNTLEHRYGDHDYSEQYQGTCNYSFPTDPGSGACTTHSFSKTWLLGDHDAEDMDIWHVLDNHSIAFQIANGQADSNGGVATSDTAGQFGVQSCLLNLCSLSISLTGGGGGGGFIATFSATPLWSQQIHYVNSCSPEDPVFPSTGGTGGGTPLIIDTTGKGFDFTDLKHCVLFDLKNDGKPNCYSWPKENSGNAWLVLDEGPDTDPQVFGNFTPHSNGDYLPVYGRPTQANGFTALSYYDFITGHPNGTVDNQNPIWPKLKLWIDVHCSHTPTVPCTAWRSELHSPEEFGITAIAYVYGGDADKAYHDKNGNWFRFWSQTNPLEGERQKPKDPLHELRIVDVWLAQK